jgi:hypothetical protein
MFVSATGAILVCYPVISHPRGTLASRSRAAQTANGVIRVRAPSLTPSVAPIWTGVRSRGLITEQHKCSSSHKLSSCNGVTTVTI